MRTPVLVLDMDMGMHMDMDMGMHMGVGDHRPQMAVPTTIPKKGVQVDGGPLHDLWRLVRCGALLVVLVVVLRLVLDESTARRERQGPTASLPAVC